MDENDHVPEPVARSSDLTLLKTLREYERVYGQLSARHSPAVDGLRGQIAGAIECIEEELKKRGRSAVALLVITDAHREGGRDHVGLPGATARTL